MLARIAQLKFSLSLACVLASFASNVQALPVADESICDDEVRRCVDAGSSQRNTDSSIAGKDGDKAPPQDVIELLGAQFANKDVVKLFDRKTAEILNTAVYPMAVGKGLVETYVSKAYTADVGEIVSTAANKWSNDGTDKSKEFGGFENRAWSNSNRQGFGRHERAYDKPDSNPAKEEQTSWIAKTASALEYIAVFLICAMFWAWFRQSKSF